MLTSRRLPSLLSLYALPAVLGQQFTDYIFPYESLGLSSKCFAAVNTTVTTCPTSLVENTGLSASSFEILDAASLKTLCESTCQNDLSQLRQLISSSCTASQDVMVPPPGIIAYPATFVVDRLLFASGIHCLKDSTSGQYCDAIVAQERNRTDDSTKAQNPDQDCSECALAVQAKQLGSPFGYDSAAASDFASTTSSCAASSYSYATPTRYALNSTSGGGAPPPAPTCASGKTYVLQESDSCNGIAAAHNVSTEALISVNGLDEACNSMPAVGTALCLPRTCKTYQVQPGDGCAGITAAANITLGQLLAWNPIISPGCTTLTAWVGRYICLSSPVGTVRVSDGQAGATTEAPVPSNTQGSSTTHCSQWYTVRAGDTCASISLAFGVALADFYFLNPGVDGKTCGNLWLGYAYCVKPVGSIETYPGYPVTVPATTFSKPPPESPAPIPSFAPPALLPRAPGTVDGCQLYKNGYPEGVAGGGHADLNSCRTWASFSDITLPQLLRWNPSLSGGEDCFVSARYSYCVLKEDDMTDPLSIYTPTSTTATTSSTTPGTPTTTAPPLQTQPGAAPGCKKWHTVVQGDGCWAISQAYGISLTDFYKWNPGVGSNCESLWLGYAVCVGV